ncbi:hypothetical protein FB645_003834 [Coemansia sp. IMI 203386]|nr:hypothetical protein FB645_003834 [Coemansia sp. IMI 203386]
MAFGGFGTAGGSGGLFGNTSTAPASTGLFGNASATSGAQGSTSLFGNTAAASSAAPASASLFGSTSTAPASTSLFGNTATSSAAPTSNLFGNAAASSAAPASTSLFGNAATTPAAPTSNLFGNAATTSAAPASTSLFGNTTTTSAAPASTSLFGNTTTTSAAPASTSLFGNTTTAPASTSLFGNTSTTSATAAIPTTTTSAASLTRKTKFVDVPTDIQKMLTEIERQKQVQIQIGSSIIADETEKEMATVSQAIQRLSQELEVVRMTLHSDRDRVDESKGQVNFAVKHAEKAASLVAHATDDGSWAQSGLTPLQVANRQKALLALQSSGDLSANAQMLELKDIMELKQSDKATSASGTKVDPYEAVRRIQFASMHYDVASEYYWAWLARVEGQSLLLAERLDQLERHVSGALASCDDAKGQAGAGGSGSGSASGGQAAQQTGARVSPKAVADVMQYQNDSFLAIAGKVAALDDDVRRLQKKLGIKSKN